MNQIHSFLEEEKNNQDKWGFLNSCGLTILLTIFQSIHAK
ncbi:hypothetical protein QY96_03104 [Bacillus thermotolerans]|nr:hypothetical protein QY96_03104 [Bacillus thermotolerans]